MDLLLLRSFLAVAEQQMVETTGSLAFVTELAVVSVKPRSGRSVVPARVRGIDIQRELGLISKLGRSLSPAAQQFSEMLV
jgi:hypothetical protein